MPFTVENKDFSIIKFILLDPLSKDDLNKVLGLISRVFETKKPFSFYVHCKLKSTPIHVAPMTKALISWLGDNQENIKKYLQSTSIIISSDVYKTLLNGVFSIRPTIKPNLITTDYSRGENFVTDIMKNFFA